MTQLRLFLALILLLLPSVIAANETPPAMPCEQRAAILDQLAEQINQSRRNAEVEIAALRVKLQTLNDQLEATKKAHLPMLQPELTP